MAWILVKVKSIYLKDGSNPIIYISDSDFILKNGVFYAFSIKWKDGEVDHLLLNPKEQNTNTWRAEFDEFLADVDNFVDRLPFGAGKYSNLAVLGTGLVLEGPLGVALAAAGVYLKPRYQMWSKAHPEYVYKIGYYNQATHEKSKLFVAPLKLNELIVLK